MSIDASTIIASEFNLAKKSVAATIRLLDDGCTIPFISRYRKEATGALDEVMVHNIQMRYDALNALAKRKETVIETIKEQGKLTSELKKRIEETLDPIVLEDIYMPFKPRRRTRAQMAVEKGLEPLARMIMSQNLDNVESVAKRYLGGEVTSVDDAIAGASDIIAEWVSENEKARAIVRARYQRNAVISSTVVKGKETEGNNYQNYFDFSQPLRTVTSHRILAMMRGAAEGFLKVSVSIDDVEMIDRLSRMFVKPGATEACAAVVRQAVKDGYRRLIRPSIETEVLGVAKSKADDSAINMFADNVRQLLLAAPLGHKRVLAIDPGFRTGCKVVCLDEQGNLMQTEVIYPNEPRNDYHGSAFKLSRLIDAFGIDAIALGNGTASRETEQFLNSIRYPRPIQIFIVNENGASIYSASEIARQEFPDFDVTVRGAVSIGRRLIDPLAELVKIEPRSIGVGQYQHDVDQNKLKDALTYTVESCVNSVGINVNTASKELLSYVSGIGPSLAANIVSYRAANGDFVDREQLMDVPRMGEKAFQQCAGFLRIPGGKNILDNTGVHPERYDLIRRIAADKGCTVDVLLRNPKLIKELDVSPYIDKEVGLPTLLDIITELEKPGRDPRATVETTEFDENVRTINDLHPGMILNGVVNNITAFGCFVDIGLHENGLVHISQLSDQFISSPAEVVSINQQVTVKVLDVDYKRGRIALTMKDI
jgi:uncharacterized protein